MAMLSGDARHCHPVVERDQYFCLPHFAGAARETYVDAGAYVGDSIERFIWRIMGCSIPFTPSSQAPASLPPCRCAATGWRGNGHCHPRRSTSCRAGLATAASPRRRHGQRPAAKPVTLRCRTWRRRQRLDRQPDDHFGGARVTFVKADVEGMEMALLEGAAETIRATGRSSPSASITTRPIFRHCRLHPFSGA